MLQIKNISMVYPNQIEAIKTISFNIEMGQIVSIIGPSGCGKTTLLEIVAGLTKQTQGEIRGISPKNIGFVFQNPNLLPWKTVKENIELPWQIQKNQGQPLTEELIRLIGLEQFNKSLPQELSGGMAQRVALARALVTNPKILLMDEPFSSLDELTRDKLNGELIKIWQKQNNTILFVTHSAREAVYLSHKIIVLSPRPAEVKSVIDINLPFPRNRSIIEFSKNIDQIRDIIFNKNQ